MIDLNRFLTAEEIRDTYQIPPTLYAKVFPRIPWHYEDENGVRYYLESRVDRFFEKLVAGWEIPKAGDEASCPRGDTKSRFLPDGLVPPDRFRLFGKVYKDITRRGWLLLQCLWEEDGVEIEDVMEAVYGHDHKQGEAAIESLRKRTNGRLLDQSCPAEIITKGGFLFLEIQGSDRQPGRNTPNGDRNTPAEERPSP